jgi:pantetheine-phosphate adenylyltransferase
LVHLAVVETATLLFDEVVVAVVANPRKARGLFTAEERLEFVTAATAHLPAVRKRTVVGLTADLAREDGATALVRSAHKETADEWSMAAMNLTTAAKPTMYLPADQRTRPISSSLIRELTLAGQVVAAKRWFRPACDKDSPMSSLS